jgi:hypothetical protein
MIPYPSTATQVTFYHSPYTDDTLWVSTTIMATLGSSGQQFIELCSCTASEGGEGFNSNRKKTIIQFGANAGKNVQVIPE